MIAAANATTPTSFPVAATGAAQLDGYGRLVVLSAKFAGREFELVHPEMIIGRTSGNDIVIDHRSISRNHAKVTRSPESGHYIIADLQSTNGVRINGQDYSKVELRGGDIVDLGHVRMRFVEPGEQFEFDPSKHLFEFDEAGADEPDEEDSQGDEDGVAEDPEAEASEEVAYEPAHAAPDTPSHLERFVIVGGDAVLHRSGFIHVGSVAFRLDEVRRYAASGANLPLAGGRLLQGATAMLVVAAAERDRVSRPS